MTPYTPTIVLKNAIERLFDCPNTAYSTLCADSGGEISDLDTQEDVYDRLPKLRELLESYVVSMAAEAEEICEPEAVLMLQNQAIGLLLGLRELQRRVPEIARFRHGQG